MGSCAMGVTIWHDLSLSLSRLCVRVCFYFACSDSLFCALLVVVVVVVVALVFALGSICVLSCLVFFLLREGTEKKALFIYANLE